ENVKRTFKIVSDRCNLKAPTIPVNVSGHSAQGNKKSGESSEKSFCDQSLSERAVEYYENPGKFGSVPPLLQDRSIRKILGDFVKLIELPDDAAMRKYLSTDYFRKTYRY